MTDRDPLLPTPVAVVWFVALVLFSVGLVAGGVLQGELAVSSTSIIGASAVVLSVIGQGLLYGRRGYDALDRLQRVATTSIALASALAAGGIIALIVIGPDRPIGTITVVAGIAVMSAAASAAASTSVLIRPHVDVMPAHVWAGIGGAGLAVPFMVAGVDPALIVGVTTGIATYDRYRGRRIHRDLERRKALAAEIDASERGIGVRGLPGLPIRSADPLPTRPWSLRERRATVRLGVAALLTVIGAWVGAILLSDNAATSGLIAEGQGYAVASLAAVPLLVQGALLLRRGPQSRMLLVTTGAALTAAVLTVLIAPTAATVLVATVVQSLAFGVAVAGLDRLVRPTTTIGSAMVAVAAALAWWVLVVTSGGIALAFVAILTTFLALRHRMHPSPR